MRIQRGIMGIVLITGLCLIPAGITMAAGRDVSVQIVELETELKECSYEQYESMMAVIQAEILSLSGQLAVAEQAVQKAEDEGDALEVMRMELLISNYEKELAEKQETLAEYRLQADMSAFYVLNGDELKTNQEAQNQYICYACKLVIAKYDARVVYLKARQTELEKKLEVEQRKLELGYTIPVEVQAIQNELERTSLMAAETEEEIRFQKDMLALYGEEEFQIDLPHMPEELEGDFVSAFCDHSAQLKLYEQQITAYGNYIDSVESSDGSLREMQLQLELVQLKQEQYRLELEQYVRQKEKDYRQSKLKVEEYDCELKVIELKIQNSELLYEKGRILETDILELKTEQARLEYERISCVCDAELSRYVLENRIEE